MPLLFHIEASDPALGAMAGRRIEVKERLTIGRGSDNDLVLPDPNRHLSKNHCVIEFDGSGYTVTDTSTNGVFLDHQPERLPRDVPTPLHDGNLLRLGGYELTIDAIIVPAQSRPPSAGEMAPPPRAAPAPRRDDPLFGDPFADLGSGPQAASPAAAPAHEDPFGFGAAAPAPAPPPAAPRGGGLAPPVGPAAVGDDLFGLAPATPEPAAPLIPDDVDLFGDAARREDWKGPTQADHAPSDQVFFKPPRIVAETIPDDWDPAADLGLTAAAPPRAAPPAAPPAAVPPPAAAPSPAPADPGDATAIEAFLAAVGLAAAGLSAAEKRAVLALAGETVAATVKGLTRILAARAETKQEFRIERTMIGAMNNNPLKFSASFDEAMRVMLLGRTPGFLSAKAAVEEALADVQSHQLAMLAGMQTALQAVVQRFDPAKLEERLDKSSLIEGILPAARKARYWELFKALYKEIAGELEDDFQTLFGSEFARAYKKQIDKL